MLNRAIELATLAHKGQRDKLGRPFILHPVRVLLEVASRVSWDTQVCAAAVLHDVVEDTSYSLRDINNRFGAFVAGRVDFLSRREGEDYCSYIRRVKRDEVATLIKRADLKDNLDPERYVEGHSGLYKRYAKALDILNGNSSAG